MTAFSERWVLDAIALPTRLRTVLDVGANSGEWTAELAQRSELVLAVEPQPELAAELHRENDPARVRVICAAAGAGYGTAPLFLFDDPACATVKHQGDDYSGPPIGTVITPVVPLDALVDEHVPPVDFIKIDVEEAEVDVLDGLTSTLERDHPGLLVEIHSAALGRAVQALLDERGYLPPRLLHPPHYPVDIPEYGEHFYLSYQA